ncbi:MAG: DnaA/Hda family protein [Pseudomonadota bacterium]
MPQQLSFDLPVRTAHGREDFFVSSANATAVAMIEGWQNWPGRKLALVGARTSGKTHLVHVWATLSGAKIIAAVDVATADIPSLASASVAVEDVDQIAGNAEAEEALFHLHNLVLAEGHSLLFTGQSAPNFWPIALPDLASRLQGTPVVALEAPDDALLTALMAKLFHDRQVVPNADVLPYLVRRIDRSCAAAQATVEALDAAALAQGCAVTRALAKEVLDKMG